jgi:outer membrane protein
MNRTFPILLLALIPAAPITAQTMPAPIVGELTYERVIDLALQNNLSIQGASAGLDAAAAIRKSAQGNRWASLALNGQYVRVDNNRIETPGIDPENWSIDLEVTQPIYAGGTISSGIEQARAAESAAEADVRTSVETALLEVNLAWYACLLAREEVVVRRDSVRLLEEQLETTRDRFDAGTVSRFEVLRSEVALANAKPPLIRAENGTRLAMVELFRVMGLPLESAQAPTINGQLSFPEDGLSLTEALSIARSNRPEYQAVEQSLRSAEAAVDLARADNLPSLSAFASYGLLKRATSAKIDDTLDGWQVGLAANWTLLDAGTTRNQVRAANARVRQAELTLDELDLAIGSEVRTAHSFVQEAAELVEASRKVVEQAEEALSLAQDRYAVGAAIQLDVLQAEVDLTEARTNEIQALHDYNVALARLRKAAGILSRGLLPAGN